MVQEGKGVRHFLTCSTNTQRGILFLCLVMLNPYATAFASRMNPAIPDRLRCELLENPMGLDEPLPRLSWILNYSRRGAGQQAYRILVASTPEILAADTARMEHVGSDGEKGHLFRAEGIPCPRSGRFGFTIRVLPSQSDLVTPYLPGLVTWANPDLGNG